MQLDPGRVTKVLRDTVLVEKIKEKRPDKLIIITYEKVRAPEAWAAKVLLFNSADDFFEKGDIVLVEPQAKDCPSYEWRDKTFFFVKKDDIICAVRNGSYIPDPVRTFIERIVREKKGGIYIPNAEGKLSLTGHVRISREFKKDEKVYYKKNSAIKIKDNLICVENYNIIARENNNGNHTGAKTGSNR